MAVGYLTGPLRRFARLHVDSDIILANVCALHVLLSLRLVAAENYVLMIANGSDYGAGNGKTFRKHSTGENRAS